MPITLDSFRSFFGTRSTEQSQAETDPPYKRALEAVHTQLLGSALDLKEQWITDLSRPYNEVGRLPDEVINLTYEARLSQLNRALADVHTLNAGELGNSTVPAHLDLAEFREAAKQASRVEPILSHAPQLSKEEEFGTVYQANVLLPDGGLGHSERRSRLEITEREDNQFDVTLLKRSYLYSGGELVSEKELTQGMYGPHRFGPFPDRNPAELFSDNLIKDYNQTAAEEHAAAVEWQQEQDHEAYYGEAETSPELASNPSSVSSSENGLDSLAESLAEQENNIRQEWQHDLESGKQNQHDLETYFAGKIDQHNTMIELAVEANPKLQETLPPQINYEQLRSEIQQQIQQQQQAPAQAMEMAI